MKYDIYFILFIYFYYLLPDYIITYDIILAKARGRCTVLHNGVVPSHINNL